MVGIPIYSVSEGAVHLLVYVNIQKCEVSSIFYFHSEFYAVVDSVWVLRKSVRFSFPCGQMTKLSSSYLYQQEGLCMAIPIAFISKSSM